MTSIVQIVPALSPPASGVADYAVEIARTLRREFSIDSVFLVGTPASLRSSRGGEFRAVAVPERSASGLLLGLEEIAGVLEQSPARRTSDVLLQFSPYGYERNGNPRWLSDGLSRWISRDPARNRLVTMFHELYASGPPWTRAFWVSQLQKATVREVFQASRETFTAVAVMAELLRAWNSPPARAIHCLPVPSNIGEPEEVLPIARRDRRICVFGLRAGANPIPRHALGTMRAIVDQWQIREIAVVGEKPDRQQYLGLGCEVTCRIAPTPLEVGRILMQSVLGLSWYPPALLGKSGVFAAYCAYGVPTLVFGRGKAADSGFDGLAQREHFLVPSRDAALWDPQCLQQISDNVRAWYMGHNVREHARIVASSIDAG